MNNRPYSSQSILNDVYDPETQSLRISEDMNDYAPIDHNHDDKYLSLENGGIVLKNVQVGTTPSNAWIMLTSYGSIAGGYNCSAKGINSIAMGKSVNGNSNNVFAFGEQITVPYPTTYCFVVGYGHKLTGTNRLQAFFGKLTDSNTDAYLVVGNGTSVSDRRNAFEVRMNGNTYTQGSSVYAINSIPSSTSELTLSEGTHVHVPEVSPTYTLPAVSDTTVTHIVFLSVNMANTSSFLFQDSDGNTIVPSLSGGDPAVGDFWQFMCEYSILQRKWMVLGYKED